MTGTAQGLRDSSSLLDIGALLEREGGEGGAHFLFLRLVNKVLLCLSEAPPGPLSLCLWHRGSRN